MSFELPPLPYSQDGLEPFISKETLKFHYGKHHKGYVDKLNDLIKGTRFEKMSLEEIILSSKDVHKKIHNNSSQFWNHTFLWNSMTPGGVEIPADLQAMLEVDFKSVEEFKSDFFKSALELFGSGYVWLSKGATGRLHIRALKDAGNPLTSYEVPILACDVWEHAYYLDTQNDREKYLNQFWQVANWEFAVSNLSKKPMAIKKSSEHPYHDEQTAGAAHH